MARTLHMLQVPHMLYDPVAILRTVTVCSTALQPHFKEGAPVPCASLNPKPPVHTWYQVAP